MCASKVLLKPSGRGPLALGFEAPMFVPIRTDPERLTAARNGEFGKGLPSRPFSASAGATSLVTGLVVVSYILNTLRPLVPEATATLDWRLPPVGPGRLASVVRSVYYRPAEDRGYPPRRGRSSSDCGIPTRYTRSRELPNFSPRADLPQFARGNNASDGLGHRSRHPIYALPRRSRLRTLTIRSRRCQPKSDFWTRSFRSIA